MKLYKKILLGLGAAFIAIQFIQPARNESGQVLATDIIKSPGVPDKILGILKNSCYDCHSNNSRYPWYVHIQPMGWIMARHIKNGKENLNFSDFGSYSRRKQANKLRAIASSIKEGSMPILSYTYMHTDAKLSPDEKDILISWAAAAKDSLDTKQ